MNAFSKDTFRSQKGYLSILVLLNHIYYFSGYFAGTYPGYLLDKIGGYAVACFVLMSGYGLYTSYQEKGPDYIKEFLRRRILPFYFTYVFFVALYLIFSILFSAPLTFRLVLTSLTFGGTVVHYGWYVQLLLVLYLVFFFLFRFISKPKLRSGLLFGFVLLYCAVSYMRDVDYFQYIPCFSFFFGIVLAKHKETVVSVLTGKRLFLLFFSFLLSAALFLWYVNAVILERIPYFVWPLVVAMSIASNLSVNMLFLSVSDLLATKIPSVLTNRVVKALGTRSLEIYLIQGIVFVVCFNYLPGKLLATGISLICPLLLAFPLHAAIHYAFTKFISFGVPAK